MKGFEYLINFFKEEGFRYEDKDTLLSFKIQGNTFLAFKNDGPFLQLVMICNTESQGRSKLLEVCNSLNQEKFILKFTVSEDSDRVWCSYEFEPSTTTTSDDFMAAFHFLDKGTDELFERLSK